MNGTSSLILQASELTTDPLGLLIKYEYADLIFVSLFAAYLSTV
jgi:hypothetical protein